MAIEEGRFERRSCGTRDREGGYEGIPPTAIDHARRRTQWRPEYAKKEAMKFQAIEALSSDIEQLQSRGSEKAAAMQTSELSEGPAKARAETPRRQRKRP